MFSFSFFAKGVQPRLVTSFDHTHASGAALESAPHGAVCESAAPDYQPASFDELAPYLLLVLATRI